MRKEFQINIPQDLIEESNRLRDDANSSLQDRSNFYDTFIKSNKILPEFTKKEIFQQLRI